LCGVEVTWRMKPGEGTWSGWLPHLDLRVARALTGQSADPDSLWARCQEPGAFTLRTTLNLKDLLRPAVQPGSRIDYEWPAEKVTLTFRSSRAFTVNAAGRAGLAGRGRDGFAAVVPLEASDRVPVEVVLPTETGEPVLTVTWHTAEDARPRPLPLRRLRLPGVPAERSKIPDVAAADVPELQGGNWARGRKVFFGEPAGCSKCHAVRGDGATIGPDLSNLPQRDYHSVLRD